MIVNAERIMLVETGCCCCCCLPFAVADDEGLQLEAVFAPPKKDAGVLLCNCCGVNGDAAVAAASIVVGVGADMTRNSTAWSHHCETLSVVGTDDALASSPLRRLLLFPRDFAAASPRSAVLS